MAPPPFALSKGWHNCIMRSVPVGPDSNDRAISSSLVSSSDMPLMISCAMFTSVCTVP